MAKVIRECKRCGGEIISGEMHDCLNADEDAIREFHNDQDDKAETFDPLENFDKAQEEIEPNKKQTFHLFDAVQSEEEASAFLKGMTDEMNKDLEKQKKDFDEQQQMIEDEIAELNNNFNEDVVLPTTSIRIVSDGTGDNTHVFANGVELTELVKIEISPIQAKTLVTARLTFENVHLDIKAKQEK